MRIKVGDHVQVVSSHAFWPGLKGTVQEITTGLVYVHIPTKDFGETKVWHDGNSNHTLPGLCLQEHEFELPPLPEAEVDEAVESIKESMRRRT